jgi:transposase
MGQLTVRQKQSAVLEAAGYDREQIATVLGVTIRTVAEWKKGEEYKAEVERFAGREIEALEPMIQVVKQELVATGLKAVEKLQELLECGDPELEHQVAKTVVQHLKLVGPRELTERAGEIEGEGNSSGPNVAIIKVDLPDAPAAAPTAIRGNAVERNGGT